MSGTTGDDSGAPRMREVTATTAEAYLRERGWITLDARVEIAPLAGGVSNEVLYVARPAGHGDFVVKQSRPRLRVAQEWLCGVERIWREVAVLETCRRVLPDGAAALAMRTPAVLHQDRENFVIAIEAAPRAHRVWKADLLAGRIEESIAAACGRLLGQLHAGTWHDPRVMRELGDRAIFDQLRLDPYFRATARRCPEVAEHFERLIATTLAERHALVHADFSPKNLLVWDDSVQGRGLMMVDFETGHYGDPAFDLGFFLTHLVLKTIYRGHDRQMLALAGAFCAAYRPALDTRIGAAEAGRLEARGMQALAGCLWARVDGKSPAEYLVDEEQREAVRRLARWIFAEQPSRWEDVAKVCHASPELARTK